LKKQDFIQCVIISEVSQTIHFQITICFLFLPREKYEGKVEVYPGFALSNQAEDKLRGNDNRRSAIFERGLAL